MRVEVWRTDRKDRSYALVVNGVRVCGHPDAWPVLVCAWDLPLAEFFGRLHAAEEKEES